MSESVSVVVPCYRSARTLPALVSRLVATMFDAAWRYEIILVVDGGSDDTWSVAHELAQRDGLIRAIQLARNYGQHNALIAGIRSARYETIVTLDDDLQHPPEEIPHLLAALTDDIDLVYAVSRQEEHGLLRNLASRSVKRALSGPMGVNNANVLSAFRAFRTFLRAGFDQMSGPNVSVDVALSWGTTRVTAVRVDMGHRVVGRSGYTLRTLTRYAINMIVGYSTAPLKLVTGLGFVVGAAGILLLCRVLWQYFHGDTTVAGFTTLASMLALFSSGQMVALGVLGEYVGRIHAHGIGRPTYVVRQQTCGGPRESESARSISEAASGIASTATTMSGSRRPADV